FFFNVFLLGFYYFCFDMVLQNNSLDDGENLYTVYNGNNMSVINAILSVINPSEMHFIYDKTDKIVSNSEV
ncbi:MAG: hypothetical protein LBE09_02120, partial [Christensenellaceae bacterium]|nr:hypothetical protein [Christensenellaceae bacterium]